VVTTANMNTLLEAIQKNKALKERDLASFNRLLVQFAETLVKERVAEIETTLKTEVDALLKNLAEEMVQTVKKGDQGIPGKDSVIPGPKGDDGKPGKNGKDGKNGSDGLNGKNGEAGKDGSDGKDGKNGSPDKPKEVAAKLDTLEDAVDMSVIKGLKYQIANLMNSIREKTVKQQGGGDSIQSYDLSPLLDGATKSFTIPSHRKIVLITSSSAPFPFRPTVDYTHTRTLLTFDPAIDAPSMLAAGQSVIIIYTR